MQCFGTEVRRGDDPLWWVKVWKQSADRALAEDMSVLVDDVRFLNEATAVRECGGLIVRLIRTDIDDTGSHVSEVEMDKIVADVTIETAKGDFDSLYRDLERILR